MKKSYFLIFLILLNFFATHKLANARFKKFQVETYPVLQEFQKKNNFASGLWSSTPLVKETFENIIYFTSDPFVGDNLIRYGKLEFFSKQFLNANIILIDPVCGFLIQENSHIRCIPISGMKKNAVEENAQLILKKIEPFIKPKNLIIFEHNRFDRFNYALSEFTNWNTQWISTFEKKIKELGSSSLTVEFPLFDRPIIKVISKGQEYTSSFSIPKKIHKNIDEKLKNLSNDVRNIYFSELLSLQVLFGKKAFLLWDEENYLPTSFSEENFKNYLQTKIKNKTYFKFISINLNTAGDWKIKRIDPRYSEILDNLITYIKQIEPEINILIFPPEKQWQDATIKKVEKLIEKFNMHSQSQCILLDHDNKTLLKYAMKHSIWFLTQDSFPGHIGSIFNSNVHILYIDKGMENDPLTPLGNHTWTPPGSTYSYYSPERLIFNKELLNQSLKKAIRDFKFR